MGLQVCSRNSSRASMAESRRTRKLACASPPSAVTKKSRLLKRTCAPRTQLLTWLVICGLLKTMRRTKVPTWRANYWCFEPPTSKFVFARLARMVCSKDTRIYTGLGRMSLLLFVAAHVTGTCLQYGLQMDERGRRSQVSKESNGVELDSVGSGFSFFLPMGRPAFPFIGQGEGTGYKRERTRRKRASGVASSFASLRGSHRSCR
jgi:hypothetical protein